MVADGLAVTVAVLIADKLVDGDHTYVLAPLAVRTWLLPIIIVLLGEETVTTGNAFCVFVIALLLKENPPEVATLR